MRAYLFILLTGFFLGVFLAKLFSCNRPVDSGPPVKTEEKTVILPSETSDWHSRIEPVSVTPISINEVPFKVKREAANVIHEVKYLPFYIKEMDTLPVDTAAIIKDYLTRKQYKETFRFPHGVVHVETDIAGNNLEKQRATLDSVKEKLVIKTISAPFSRFYAGFQVNWTPKDLITEAGGTISYQFKNGRMIGQGIKYRPSTVYDNGGIEYETKIEIPLGRRK